MNLPSNLLPPRLFVSFFISLSVFGVLAHGQTFSQSAAQNCNCDPSNFGYPVETANEISRLKQQVDQIQPSHLGFWKIDSNRIPPAVKNVASSVVMVFAPTGPLKAVEEIFGPHSIQDVITEVSKTPVSEELYQGEKDLILYELNNCPKGSNEKTCSIYESDTKSSGYLVGDGSRVRTAYHAVRDYVKQNTKVQSASGLTTARVPVFIYDLNGKLLYSSVENLAVANFRTSNLERNNGSSFSPPNDDLVELKLNKIIGKPIVSASTSPQVGDPVYTLGYPMPTKDRAAYNAPDSTGTQLTASIGNVISVSTSAQKQGVNPSLLTEETKAIYRNMITTDADGAPGLSGGVTVNALGQALGTYTAGFPAEGNATPSHVSYSSNDRLLDFNF